MSVIITEEYNIMVNKVELIGTTECLTLQMKCCINPCCYNQVQKYMINRLTPNDPYMGRTTPLTSKCCILYIYSTNIGTEYFKHALYSPFFLFKTQFVS